MPGRVHLSELIFTGPPSCPRHAYLGMSDERLPVPVADLVPRAGVQDYPADLDERRTADAGTTRVLLPAHLLTARSPALHPRIPVAVDLKPEADADGVLIISVTPDFRLGSSQVAALSGVGADHSITELRREVKLTYCQDWACTECGESLLPTGIDVGRAQVT